MDDLTLGQWLKACRVERGLSLRQVERLTDGKVSNALLCQVETGHIKHPSAIVLHRLAVAYGLDFGRVLARAGDVFVPPGYISPHDYPPWRIMTREEYDALTLIGKHTVEHEPDGETRVWLHG